MGAREAITLSERAAVLGSYLRPETEEEEEETVWLGVDIGLTLGGALLVGLSWLDLYPLVLLPDLFYAVALVIALAVVTVVRCYRVFGQRIDLGF